MQRNREATQLTITEHDAVAKSSNRSTPRVAKVLGREVRDGVESVWLDRLLHLPGEEFQQWTVTGAISSVCCRSVGNAAS